LKANLITEEKNKYLFFTGKQWDEDAQLYYFNARWYDPETGRFITEDPVRDGLLWYAYCSNNPMGFVDHTGLEGEESGEGEGGSEGQGILGSIGSWFSGLFGNEESAPSTTTIIVNVYIVENTKAEVNDYVDKQLEILETVFSDQEVDVQFEIAKFFVEDKSKDSLDLTNIASLDAVEDQVLIDAITGDEYDVKSEWGGSLNLIFTDSVGTSRELGLSTIYDQNIAIVEALSPPKTAAHEIGHLLLSGHEGHTRGDTLMSLDPEGTAIYDLVKPFNENILNQWGGDPMNWGTPVWVNK